jgi:hypothetical protein
MHEAGLDAQGSSVHVSGDTSTCLIVRIVILVSTAFGALIIRAKGTLQSVAIELEILRSVSGNGERHATATDFNRCI